MAVLDGKKLAQKILHEVKQEIEKNALHLRLAVVVVGNNPITKKFIAEKKRAAASVGIDVRVYPFEASVSAGALRKELAVIVHEEKNTGVIVQLPLPAHMDTQQILNAVIPGKDVDVLSARAVGDFAIGKGRGIPPVAGAVEALFEEYGIEYREKNIVLVGAGQLVGKPVALWLLREGASFSVVRSSTPNPDEIMRRADIIISGIGKPAYITADMIKEGAVVVDAGTSESGGKTAGDVDFDSVSKKAAFVAPVPGGVGPVTVAVLLKNLVTLSRGRV